VTAPILFDLPELPPSVNNLFITVGKRRIRAPGYTHWAERSGWLLKGQVKPSQHIEGPFAISLAFVRPDKRRRDLDNLCKAVIDLAVKNRLVSDDSECQRIEASWVSDGPPCRVVILPCQRRGE